MLLMQGLYEDSIRYYVRAVAMNPKADNAWQYLRISLRYDVCTLNLPTCEPYLAAWFLLTYMPHPF
jgi:hypothetical protein